MVMMTKFNAYNFCFFTMLLTLFKRVKTTLCGYSRSDTITPPSESDLTKT